MPAPRQRQLRRDPLLFDLLMNARRLELEEEMRVAKNPDLEAAPDAELLQIQEISIDWLSLAATYAMQKYRCTFAQVLPGIRELMFEIKDTIPHEQLLEVPLEKVMTLPPEAQARRRQPAS